ncbi:pyridoxal phosphate-dependent decarboxylase family protein [Nocardioides sp.]|uniref:pyridoxal phosphate-dependent decarboxylase family protein n=1 Tax=Nocardioides sp. TaxID=35761 RepID=UPI002B275E6E|nr:aminotransferase class V-fold PLP-dependent enzyme [Nocardioides sp.]
MAEPTATTGALTAAANHAQRWLDTVATRTIPARVDVESLLPLVGGALPDEGCDAVRVVDEVAAVESGLMASQSGRFFGWVMGGTLPAALAADWLVSAWDQNAGMRDATPGVVALEEAAARWILDLLHLPSGSDVGFVTGATMANFTCLAAARGAVLQRVGHDVHADGLTGAPRLHVLVGQERHDTVDLALRYLGLGTPTVVAADEQGRMRLDALAEALDAVPADAPLIVCLQAGNVHSGAFDPVAEAAELAHARGAWVHVDGAFGLWAAASPRLTARLGDLGAADSWTTDSHKTHNTPYDCGEAIVRDPAAMRAAMGVHASYLLAEESGPGNPYERVPELSRRARGVPVWAALRSLGRTGVTELVDTLADRAVAIAAGLSALPGVQILNDVTYTQVCLCLESDEQTKAVGARLHEDGRILLSASHWQGRAVLRISVSNARTSAADVATVIEAVASTLR